MNHVIIIGRLTADPVVKQTANNIAVCSFTVAVDRKFKDQNGNKQTDFISCVAWRGQAEVIGNYFSRGSRIGITGSIQRRILLRQKNRKRSRRKHRRSSLSKRVMMMTSPDFRSMCVGIEVTYGQLFLVKTEKRLLQET